MRRFLSCLSLFVPLSLVFCQKDCHFGGYTGKHGTIFGVSHMRYACVNGFSNVSGTFVASYHGKVHYPPGKLSSEQHPELNECPELSEVILGQEGPVAQGRAAQGRGTTF